MAQSSAVPVLTQNTSRPATIPHDNRARSRRGLMDAEAGLPHRTDDAKIDTLRSILLALVRRDGRDLTARQLTAFLSVYTADSVHTVSTLADEMNISRPGVTRVMDRLVQFDLMAREEDREDRRRVLARRTARGLEFFRDLSEIIRESSAKPRSF